MDRFEAMTILAKVAETGSFSAASRQMGMPLATVSRKVGELESHLGTQLLTRTTRKVALTDTGATYLASAKRILEDVTETERIAVGEFRQPRGELILTAPLLFGRLHVLPVITDFLALYPDIHIRLVLTDRNLHLIGDHVDAALRIGPLPDSRVVATRLGSLRTVVCASEQLLAQHGTPSEPQALAAMPCVSFQFSDIHRWSFRSKDKQRLIEVPIAPRLAVTTAEAAVWAATQGLGVTQVLDYQCAEAVRIGSLRIILRAFEPERLPVHLIHAGSGPLPSKTRTFLDFATTRLRKGIEALQP